jgi:hypothetical protein
VLNESLSVELVECGTNSGLVQDLAASRLVTGRLRIKRPVWAMFPWTRFTGGIRSEGQRTVRLHPYGSRSSHAAYRITSNSADPSTAARS